MFKQFTLGIEEEFQIVDPHTRELRSHVSEILEEGKMLLGEQVKPEMIQSMIEVGTGICTPFVWRRDFDRGIVLVNTGVQPLVVRLERSMRRINGNLDRVTNNGTSGDIVTVSAGDAVFLLRNLEDLVDAGWLPAEASRGPELAWSSVAPNPSGGGDAVRLVLAARAAGLATVALYDVSGRRVRSLHDGPLDAGPHAFAWDGRDDLGRRVPAGLYFARVRAGDGEVAVRKIVRQN